MTGLVVSHAYNNPVADENTPGVKPSDWNAPHVITLAGVLKALDALTASNGSMAYFTGADTAALAPLTLFAIGLLAAADPATACATLGAINTSGGTMAGDLAMATHKVTGLGTPTASTDAVTKAYVDAIAALVSGALVFKGAWDASAGTFPGAGAAQIGWFYKVSVAGTVNSISFSVGDDVFAIVNNASTTIYSPNWLKIEGSLTLAEIQTAVGFTFGSLAALSSITASLISDATANGRSLITATNYASMLTLLGISTVGTTGAYSDLTGKPTLGSLAALSSVTASLISDATANGRSLITATNYAAMLTLLGISTVGTTGAYSDLTGKPTLGSLAALSSVTTSLISDASANGRSLITAANYAAMLTLLGISTVGTTGAYSDLTGKPTLGSLAALSSVTASLISDATANGRSLITATNYAAMLTLLGISTVGTTGAYSDLTGKPTLGTAAALNVGVAASNVVQLNGSAQLPAVDGSLLTGIGGAAAGALVSISYLTSSQTVTIPAGATKGRVRGWGGTGGSGGPGAGSAATGGTGAPGYFEKFLTGLTAANTLTYTNGALGSAGTSGGNGGNGGATSLASGTQTISTLTANGSNGSATSAGSASAGTAGGTASGGDLNLTGAPGMSGTYGFCGIGNSAGSPGAGVMTSGAPGKVGTSIAGIAGYAGGCIIEWYK